MDWCLAWHEDPFCRRNLGLYQGLRWDQSCHLYRESCRYPYLRPVSNLALYQAFRWDQSCRYQYQESCRYPGLSRVFYQDLNPDQSYHRLQVLYQGLRWDQSYHPFQVSHLGLCLSRELYQYPYLRPLSNLALYQAFRWDQSCRSYQESCRYQCQGSYQCRELCPCPYLRRFRHHLALFAAYPRSPDVLSMRLQLPLPLRV